MRKLTSVITTAFFLSATSLAMANDTSDSSGSMDLEKPVTDPTTSGEMSKHDKRTGDARGSTTGEDLIKSDAQRDEAEEGGLDGVK